MSVMSIKRKRSGVKVLERDGMSGFSLSEKFFKDHFGQQFLDQNIVGHKFWIKISWVTIFGSKYHGSQIFGSATFESQH
jgi:hypothetical protein